MRCVICQEQIEQTIPDIRMLDWQKLFNYFEHEFTEGEITNKTWESMTAALSSLRPNEEG